MLALMLALIFVSFFASGNGASSCSSGYWRQSTLVGSLTFCIGSGVANVQSTCANPRGTCPTKGSSCYFPAVDVNASAGCEINIGASFAACVDAVTTLGTCYSLSPSPIGSALRGTVAASISSLSTAGDAVTITAGIMPASSVNGACTGFQPATGGGTSVTCPDVRSSGGTSTSCDLPSVGLSFLTAQPNVQFAFQVTCPDAGGCALISNDALSPSIQVCTEDDVTTTTSMTTTRTTTTRTTTRPATTTSAVAVPTSTRTTVPVTTRPASGSSLISSLGLILFISLCIFFV